MNSKWFIFSFILLIGCLNQVSSDIYTSAITYIATALATHVHQVQLTLVIYMIAVMFSLLCYGPLSDRIGRKKPLLIGLTICAIGTLLAMFAFNIQMLLLARFIQGLGTGACAGLWRSIFRDNFSGNEMVKYAAYLGIIVAFTIPAAPLIGAYLEYFIAWRAIFGFIFIYSLIALWVTYQKFHEKPINHYAATTSFRKTITQNFKVLFTNRIYAGITSCMALTFGAFFSWFLIMPVIFIHNLNLIPIDFGLFSFFGGGFCYLIGGIINGQLVKLIGSTILLRIGWSFFILSGLILLCLPQQVMFIFIAGLLIYLGGTFIWPHCFSIAMTPMGHISGSAGTMYSFIQMLGASLVGGIVTYFSHNQPIFLADVFIVNALISWIIYEFVVKTKINKQPIY